MNNTELLISHLIEMRKKYDLFSIERCAADTGVTSQTVRNFESRTARNADVVLYYISKILWELQKDAYYSEKLNISVNEVVQDHKDTIALLAYCY